MESGELRRLCWDRGLPGDFDVAQLSWQPGYDPFYYEQLSQRARTMHLFRDEYIFDLSSAVVVEIPQAGHATYVFEKPERLDEWMKKYVKISVLNLPKLLASLRVERDDVVVERGHKQLAIGVGWATIDK